MITPPKPSIGRIVHYVSYGTPAGEYLSECRAAVITEVHEQVEEPPGSDNYCYVVGLCVLNPTGQFFNRNIIQDDITKASGTWHWPEQI